MTDPKHAGLSASQPVVLHVTAVAYTLSTLMLNQLNALKEAGYEVRVASSPDEAGFPTCLAPFSPIPVRLPRTLSPIKVLRGLWQLRQVTWQLKPDLLHLHTPAVAIPARMVPRWLFPPGMKIAYTVHGYPHTWSRSFRDRVLEALEKLLSPRADLTLLQSSEDLTKARASSFRGDLVYLGNGVDEHWFGIKPAKRDGPLRLLFMGRLVKEKGILELLDAVSEVPEVTLDIAGEQLPTDRDGVLREIEVRIQSPDLANRVRLLGMLERDCLLKVMAQAHVIALPSHREGVPQALMQGLAAGRPAIATNVRGCNELVIPGKTGILVSVRDTDALAAAIRELAELNADEFHSWGVSAQDCIRRTRAIDDVIKRLTSAYASVLK